MAKNFVLSSGGFNGLDQRAGSSVNIKSLPYMQNFFVNESGALEKRNVYTVVDTIEGGKSVNAIWHGELQTMPTSLVAADKGVYIRFDGEKRFKPLGETRFAPQQLLPFGKDIYCLGGGLYKCLTNKLEAVEGYIPLVATGCGPNGDGTVCERPNMLTAKRRVRYSGDGTSLIYALPEVETERIISVTVNGTECKDYIGHTEAGSVEFSSPPDKGHNNIEVCYEARDNARLREIIINCKYGVVFESRLFVFGNPDYPDRLYHTELADGLPCAEYFTEAGYHAFDKSVTALIPCFNRLLIFFNDSACFTYAELKADSLGGAYTSFPVYDLHSSKGNLMAGVGCAFENTPVTLCRDGLNKWVSTAIADERSAVVFSQRAYSFITNALYEQNPIFMYNRKTRSELWVCTQKGTLIYNYGLDCFYMYDIKGINSLCEHENGLWLGMDDGSICLFSEKYSDDNGVPITASFETPFCSFGAPYKLKSINGAALCFEGGNAVEAELSLIRGNVTEKQDPAVKIVLPCPESRVLRRVKLRLHMKRLYSCKLVLKSDSEKVRVKELHIFGKQTDGGLRIN